MIRVDIKEIEINKKINKAKNWLLDRINKIDETVARLFGGGGAGRGEGEREQITNLKNKRCNDKKIM